MDLATYQVTIVTENVKMMQFIKIIAVNKILQFFLEILRVVDDRCDMMSVR